jgi:predicted permease
MASSFLLVPLFGLVPALRGTDLRIADTLKVGGERVGRAGASRFRSLLVVAQVGLSLMLMLGSGLFARSLLNLQAMDSGFLTEGVLSLDALLPAFTYRTPEERGEAWREVEGRLLAVPGVLKVGFVNTPPLGGDGPKSYVWSFERPPSSAADRVPATRRWASQGYFEALEIPLLAGRHFRDGEPRFGPTGEGTVVINEALARSFFPGEDPLGKTLVLDWDRPVDLEVIGIVADIREEGPGSEPVATFYLPARWDYDMLTVLVKTGVDPQSAVGAVRQAFLEADGDITLSAFQSMQDRLSATLFQPRFRTVLVGAFALVALILSSIGLYGVLAYFVGQRRHEISIRRALGAGTGSVSRLVLTHGMALVGGGIVVGVAGALLGGRLMASTLVGVAATDPPTFFGMSLTLALVGLLACVGPVLRAARTDPAEAIRAE